MFARSISHLGEITHRFLIEEEKQKRPAPSGRQRKPGTVAGRQVTVGSLDRSQTALVTVEPPPRRSPTYLAGLAEPIFLPPSLSLSSFLLPFPLAVEITTTIVVAPGTMTGAYTRTLLSLSLSLLRSALWNRIAATPVALRPTPIHRIRRLVDTRAPREIRTAHAYPSRQLGEQLGERCVHTRTYVYIYAHVRLHGQRCPLPPARDIVSMPC